MGTAASANRTCGHRARSDLYRTNELPTNSHRRRPQSRIRQLPGHDQRRVIESTSTLGYTSNHYKANSKRNIGTVGHKSRSSSDRTNWDNDVKRKDIKEIHISLIGKDDIGFCIRGGIEHGIGIYVSHLEEGSIAWQCGLEPGDQILTLNGESFRKISQKDASEIIRSTTELHLCVRNVGCIPGSFETHESYQWVDPMGRSVSPPPETDCTDRYNTLSLNKSRYMLLKQNDERKVRLFVRRGENLGVLIRGGNEFGLGIFVTGVDSESPSEHAGLQIGDQILDVNGHSFLDIPLQSAVRILTSLHHLILTVKDVGKVPHSRDTYAMTDWINTDSLSNRSSTSRNTTPAYRNHSRKHAKHFVKGAGSQLMLSSMTGYNTNLAIVEEKSRRLLTPQEQNVLHRYLRSYINHQLDIKTLTNMLYDILNTTKKLALLDDVRGLVRPNDAEIFERFVCGKTDNTSEYYVDSGVSHYDDYSESEDESSQFKGRAGHYMKRTHFKTAAEVYDSF